MDVQPRLARRYSRLVATLGAVTSLALATASLAPSPVAASVGYNQFCWGVTLPGGTGTTCDSLNHNGIVGYVTEVAGSGYDHSVCVWAAFNEGIKMCSAGPNQGVYNKTPPAIYPSYGIIGNNAAGTNKVYGAVILCAASKGC